MTLAQLKQLYYSRIYPYISYTILACGSAYKTQIKSSNKTEHSDKGYILCNNFLDLWAKFVNRLEIEIGSLNHETT